jgi:hypothetical protein
MKITQDSFGNTNPTGDPGLFRGLEPSWRSDHGPNEPTIWKPICKGSQNPIPSFSAGRLLPTSRVRVAPPFVSPSVKPSASPQSPPPLLSSRHCLLSAVQVPPLHLHVRRCQTCPVQTSPPSPNSNGWQGRLGEAPPEEFHSPGKSMRAFPSTG